MKRKSITKVSFLILYAMLLLRMTNPSSAQLNLTRVPGSGDPRVTSVQLKADNAYPGGPCPITVNFSGYIKTAGPGTVTYTFTRSDGATAPVYTIEFKEAGTQTVTATWTLGDAVTLPTYSGWQAIRILSPNQMESSHETGGFSINCGAGKEKPEINFGPPTTVTVMPARPPAQPASGQQTGGPGSASDDRGTFRVTLLGFVVNHETRDTLLETDGKRDEVYQVPVVFLYDRDRGLETRAFSVFGPVFGDTNNHPTYQRAGSASARGGLRTGDAFPAAHPWEGRTPAGPSYGFPSIMFEGELRPLQNAAVIIPSLWESDGNQELFRAYLDSIASAQPSIRDYAGSVVSSPRLISNDFRPTVGSPFGLGSTVTLDETLFDMRDRPIGMERLVAAPDRFTFEPYVLVLTYEGAREAVSRDLGFGPGVIEVRYDEARELEGSYSLYFKVERMR